MKDKYRQHALSAIAVIMVTLPPIIHAATTVVSAYYDGVAIHNADVQTCGTTAHEMWAFPVGTSLLHDPGQETARTERMRVTDPRPTG